MRLIRRRDHRRTPWKNDRGETVELAAAPDPADRDGFAWRVSLAEIADSAPFSPFPAVDRTFALVAGGPLRLRAGDALPVELAAGSPPLSFPGDVATEAWLLGPPALALNVMTRRGRFTHRLTRHELAPGDALQVASGPALLLCGAGAVEVATPTVATLAALDSLVMEASDPPWRLRAGSAATVYLALVRAGPVTAETGTSGKGPWPP